MIYVLSEQGIAEIVGPVYIFITTYITGTPANGGSVGIIPFIMLVMLFLLLVMKLLHWVYGVMMCHYEHKWFEDSISRSSPITMQYLLFNRSQHAIMVVFTMVMAGIVITFLLLPTAGNVILSLIVLFLIIIVNIMWVFKWYILLCGGIIGTVLAVRKRRLKPILVEKKLTDE